MFESPYPIYCIAGAVRIAMPLLLMYPIMGRKVGEFLAGRGRRRMGPAFLQGVLIGVPLLVAAVLVRPDGFIMGRSWSHAFAAVQVVIVGPLAQELLFRGLVFAGLRVHAHLNVWWSGVLSTALFVYPHLTIEDGDTELTVVRIGIYVLQFGFLCCWLYERTGWCLAMPFGFHAVCNLAGIALLASPAQSRDLSYEIGIGGCLLFWGTAQWVLKKWWSALPPADPDAIALETR